jgi:signal transduction histidine kinase
MASAAHELRTPVAVVRGEAELALTRSNRSPEDYRESLDSVRSEAVRMSRLVDDLLNLSRTEGGEIPLRKAPLDLKETIEETVRGLEVAKADQGVEVMLQLVDPAPFEGDRMMLQRVFANLIENAMRHSVPGSPVEVSLSRADGCYDFRVRNHGPGIPSEHIDRIFEPFFRGHHPRGGGHDNGAGLGLPLARASARAHGGAVHGLTTGEQGTTFQVTLPSKGCSSD